MTVLKAIGIILVTLGAAVLVAWAGAPRTIIKPTQTIYETAPGIPLQADPSTLNPANGEGDAPAE